MSKFRDPPPPGAPSTTDNKLIPFPATGEMSLEQRKAELEAFSRAASAELILRLKYNTLKSTLDAIDRYDPVPDDWRARLEGREAVEDDVGDDDVDEEGDDDDL